MSLKDKTKAELLAKLKIAGMDMSVVKGKRVGELQDISVKIDICIKDNKGGKGEIMEG